MSGRVQQKAARDGPDEECGAGPRCPASGERLYLTGVEAGEGFFSAQDDELSHSEGWDLVFGGRFGRGVLNLVGERHRSYRQALMPLLRRSAAAEHRETIETLLARAIRSLPPGAPVDLHAFTQRIAFNVAARLFAGIDEDETEELYALFEELRTPMPSVRELGTPDGRQAARRVGLASRRLRSLLRGAVHRFDQADGPALRLRALPDPPSDDVIAENLAILILAGYETTGYLTARLLWLLARHPQQQDAVRTEDGDPLTAPLLDAVFTETARLHPPLAWLPRRAMTDLRLGGTTAPAGSEVFYSVTGTQRDARLFPDPGAFRPGRFLDGERHGPLALTPFGAGRRVCPGTHLGTLETKLIASTMVRTFRLSAPGGPYIADVSTNGTSVTPAKPLLARLDRLSG
ncbi:cytochrome P450 [Streptomyces sp. NPDC050504]|uniref:cytochrome P450 n=1 Tax=Streptomyces sp. NPDC050504 TaxID=3365618 RepID=UPI0037AD7F3D